jgi:HEAT repeat protein
MRMLIALVILAGLAVPPGAQAQTPPPPAPPQRPIEQEEAIGLANGWVLLAEGKAAEAAAIATSLIAKYPRSAAVLAFAVDAHIARGGWSAGLDQYERWLGSHWEELLVVRQVARALLREVSGQRQNPTARLEALKALAADGDALAHATLTEASNKGGYAEARALATLGDPGGVGILIAAMNTGAMDSLEAIRALGSSGNPLATPALLKQLTNRKPEVRGAAAEALGHLGGADVVTRLQEALRNDDAGYVRGKAAAALYRLRDDSGLPIIRDLATATALAGRLAAAEALAPRPDASWLPLVESLISADQQDVQLLAAGLLRRADPARAREVLESLSHSGNEAIREQAGQAMAEAVANDLPALRKLLRSPERLTRVAAARAILALAR